MPPPPRRSRPSLPNSPLADDITHLTLSEIRDRLERNERVLSSSLFTPPSPSTSLTPSLIQPTSPTTDPILSKLLQARQCLLEREQVLLMQDSMGNMDIKPDVSSKLEMGMNGMNPVAESSAEGRRRSSTTSNLPYPQGNATRSGKAKALEVIQAGEYRLAPDSLILPVAQTLALGQRDSAQATAQSLSNLTISSHPSRLTTKPNAKSKYPNQPRIDDEISRAQAQARIQAFMTYKGDGDAEDDEGDEDGFLDEGENWGMEDENAYEGVGAGLEGRDGEEVKRARGTGEEMDEFGEDEEEWAEGNDEYMDKNR